MIYRYLGKSKIIFQSSFRKLTSVLLQVQEQKSYIKKKQILNQFYFASNPQDQNSIINILNFMRDKPKTGLAHKSLQNIMINKFFLNSQNPPKNMQELIVRLSQKQNNKQSIVQLSQVQQLLQSLKTIQGKNSINKKKEKLHQALANMTVEQIRFILRILTKKLRIGLTDKSFQFKHQQQKKEIQQKNNDPSKIHLPNIQLMLAQPLRTLQDVYKFCQNKQAPKLIADLKYDGQRTLLLYKKGVGIQLMSRRRKQQTNIYKNLTQLIFNQLEKIQEIKSIQIDGQIVCVSKQEQPLPMQTLLTKRGKDFQQKDEKIIIFGFDVLQYNGQNYFNKQLSFRRSKIPSTSHLKMTQFLQFQYPQDKQKLLNFYKKILQRKHEGLIIKGNKDLYFTNGSRRHWGKFKKGCKIQNTDTGQIDLDLVVMGVFYGQGKRSQLFSAYLLGTYHEGKLYPVSKVGSGFTDQQLQNFTQLFKKQVVKEKPNQYQMPQVLRVDFFLQPKYVFQVKCQDLTRSPLYTLNYQQGKGGVSLRFPVFQRLRQDKAPKQCNSNDLFEYIEKENKK